jgi:hypothetical protein
MEGNLKIPKRFMRKRIFLRNGKAKPLTRYLN